MFHLQHATFFFFWLILHTRDREREREREREPPRLLPRCPPFPLARLHHGRKRSFHFRYHRPLPSFLLLPSLSPEMESSVLAEGREGSFYVLAQGVGNLRSPPGQIWPTDGLFATKGFFFLENSCELGSEPAKSATRRVYCTT